AEIETGINFEYLGKDMIKKEYQFPNGYGVSIIKGIHTHNLWEALTYYENAYNKIQLKRYEDWRGVELHILTALSLERP
ncbi:hypothetical protein R0J90_19445, partial [Micrococcus sp. SIMBA_144]